MQQDKSSFQTVREEELVDGTSVSTTYNLQEFDPEREEENQINKENAKHVFSPEFIPYYHDIAKAFNLTEKEALIYGFIRFYMKVSSNRFYFTNEQLAKLLNCSPNTINISISNLSKKNLIRKGHKIKAGGGTIRFISSIYISEISHIDYQKSDTHNIRNLIANKNKIKENKIKGEGGTHTKKLKSSKSDITSTTFKEYLEHTIPFSNYMITEDYLVRLAEKIDAWATSKGKIVKDWKATARNWLLSDIDAGKFQSSRSMPDITELFPELKGKKI